jgi:hypothetical protein
MADGSTPAKGPRTLCAEAVTRVLYEASHDYELSEKACTDPALARKISDAVIAVALQHINVRMNFPTKR